MDGNWFLWTLSTFIGALLALMVIGLLVFIFFRRGVQWLLTRFMKRLMQDRYAGNIWEMVTALTRINPILVMENTLRAEAGEVIARPFGSPRKFLHCEGLIFSPAQLATFPRDEEEEIEMGITIGPKAKKPLKLKAPIMAGAMGYGVGVSDKVKIAIAQGTAAVGTCTNTGEGPLLPEERENAKFLIVQYSSGHWSHDPEILKQADAIEIHIGQGASVGTASIIPKEFIGGRASQLMGVEDEELVVIPARHEEIKRPRDVGRLVEKLRDITGGVPIGVKIVASAAIEADLEVAVNAKVDFISVDGAQAGTKGAAPILEDDFGLPTIFAISRAVRFLKKRGVKDHISLLSGGGYANPGHCLKAMALGVDGVYMGTSLLWAMTHDQVTKSIPWEPPTQLTYYSGTQKDLFDVEAAAKSLKRFFDSYIDEMKLAIRALGKTSVRDVNASDLVALDDWTSKVTQVPLVTDVAARRAEQP